MNDSSKLIFWIEVLVATVFGFFWGYYVSKLEDRTFPDPPSVTVEAPAEPKYGNSESKDITPCKTPTPKPKASKKLI